MEERLYADASMDLKDTLVIKLVQTCLMILSSSTHCGFDPRLRPPVFRGCGDLILLLICGCL